MVGEGIKRLHFFWGGGEGGGHRGSRRPIPEQRGPQQEMRTPAQARKLRTINIFMRPCIFHARV